MSRRIVIDEGHDRKYWTQTPNIVFDLGLRPFPLALYVQLKRITGDAGQADETTRQLAARMDCSAMAISKALAELAIPRRELGGKALVRVRRVDDGKGARKARNIVTLTDVWPENMARYGAEAVNTVDGAVNIVDGPVNNVYGGRKHSVHPKEPRITKKEPKTPVAASGAGGASLPFVVFDPETTNGTATQRPAQTTDTSKSERPDQGSAAAPAPKWQPFYDAVGASLGVPWAKAGGTALAWAGNLARQFGATSAGDVAAAVALWAEFEAWARAAKYGSGHRWDFVNKATAGDHAGKFLSDRSPARAAERDAAVPPSTRWAHAFDPPPVFAADDGWGVVEVAP